MHLNSSDKYSWKHSSFNGSSIKYKAIKLDKITVVLTENLAVAEIGRVVPVTDNNYREIGDWTNFL